MTTDNGASVPSSRSKKKLTRESVDGYTTFSHCLRRRATIRLLSATSYILALHDSERGTAAKRELCLGAPPSASRGLESTYAPSIPTPAPTPPSFANIVVVICFERSPLSPGDR